jgi:hypothetical protein
VADIKANMAGRSLWFVDAPDTKGQIQRNIFHDQASADRLSESHVARGIEAPVVLSVCPPYRRGTIPFELFKPRASAPATLILGSDVGGNYARWVVMGVAKNLRDVAVIDWGEELDPDSVLEVMLKKSWRFAGRDDAARVVSGWMDARWRPTDVYKACLRSRGMLIPTKGLGGAAALNVKLWTFVRVPTYHERFKELHYNDQRAKDGLYIEKIKRMRSRIWFPVDVEEDPDFMAELCAERQVQDRRGFWIWSDEPTGPNHYGDSLKEAVLGLNFMTRQVGTGGK